YEGYGSAVALADVNHDSYPDLATGGWWDNTRIFINTGSALPVSPTWNSGGTSVVEKIVFGDIGPRKSERTNTVSFPGTGSQQLFYLPHQNIQYILSVQNDGNILNSDEYTYSRVDGWLSVATAPSSTLEVCYNYSNSLDMVITNWDSNIGNYLYYNQLGESDLEVIGEINWTQVQPGSSIYDSFEVANIGDFGSELDWIVTETPLWGNFTITPSFGIDLTPEQGAQTVYVEIDVPTVGGPVFEGEIRIENQQDPADFGIVPICIELSGEPGPIFTIDAIEGKIGVSITFRNTGDGEATDVQWSLGVSGGMFNLIDKSLHDRIISLSAGESYTISSGLILGIGSIKIQFMVSCNEGATKQVQATGKQFLIFTSINT
ncbi:MAG: FG-GAP repeat protein, partial [Candidatus Thermoplasmatota archaeon]|nr:FG-GAP repeat protein [Candidatus Thermoplasmatota archaeon]